MKVEVKLDAAAIKKIQEAAKAAAVEALEVTYSDLVKSKTMPFDNGIMQNNQTHVKLDNVDLSGDGKICIALTTDAIQARRLYYHPEYNFKQSEGANGTRGAKWLEPYISGDKKDFVKTEFAKALKRRIGTK